MSPPRCPGSVTRPSRASPPSARRDRSARAAAPPSARGPARPGPGADRSGRARRDHRSGPGSGQVRAAGPGIRSASTQDRPRRSRARRARGRRAGRSVPGDLRRRRPPSPTLTPHLLRHRRRLEQLRRVSIHWDTRVGNDEPAESGALASLTFGGLDRARTPSSVSRHLREDLL